MWRPWAAEEFLLAYSHAVVSPRCTASHPPRLSAVTTAVYRCVVFACVTAAPIAVAALEQEGVGCFGWGSSHAWQRAVGREPSLRCMPQCRTTTRVYCVSLLLLGMLLCAARRGEQGRVHGRQRRERGRQFCRCGCAVVVVVVVVVVVSTAGAS